MGYQIIYSDEKNEKGKGRGFRILVMSAGFFLLFLTVVSYFWPDGMELMRNLLPMEDFDQTFRAAEVFSQELASGFSIKDAAGNFWDTITEYECTH